MQHAYIFDNFDNFHNYLGLYYQHNVKIILNLVSLGNDFKIIFFKGIVQDHDKIHQVQTMLKQPTSLLKILDNEIISFNLNTIRTKNTIKIVFKTCSWNK